MKRSLLPALGLAWALIAVSGGPPPAAGTTAEHLIAALPSGIRLADVRPKLYRTVTEYALTQADHAVLGLAYRAPGYVTRDLYKVSAASDRHHHVALLERSCCALQEWILFRPAVPLGIDARDVDLSAAKVGGISLGSSPAAVMHRFGHTAPAAQNERTRLLRYRHQRNHDCATFYTFVVEDRRVAAISVKNAC
ncbi:MAG: hypothetical protein JWM87_2206 [Candidatus Eremiobacteraeota bacterium]|nr:hypothetical protein [Candidatus Eremiobacteraeota bacterium]